MYSRFDASERVKKVGGGQLRDTPWRMEITEVSQKQLKNIPGVAHIEL